MLSVEEQKDLEEELKIVPYKKAATIEALKIVQKHRGWVSDDGVKDIAEFLEITPDEVDSVATFYNLIFRRKVGKHVILVCDSVSCWILGYNQILDYLNKKLGIKFGETTSDGKFTLLPISCLGTCDHAPALMIDNDLYRDLTTDLLDPILEKYS
ncbi:NADH:ubiquinone oxidoreductase, subunit E [Candidatus Kuenenia stuttgartiensis]|jgi:NADH-quinone oxidoreductase subunit E|uniref:NADH:ubiquinone oxidoreductase, subunit E n=1 Tax=Kuenenia stuttgartiensis TaxID=174633 RepID=Q1Q757_KUEST|nr:MULTISPECIES: NADH-quinone oxidoreductase subunit NuoE [Kuenenia]MBE7549022.1 NADH-quinone oxidoreductase subunit NuoE [Planctomycetia bacterium]MBZ0190746.1 NADH-quinone oxidoreductase subunit NuoE [Candidatus Kuenenia stuttgartiensis]MCF6151572.1 NADH-quinone oxidoreductase subunit NuoE [Candidatus Kuenenia stuttgartiensis]MCL4727319.1 NADH-quinone oxidoreductase subunit NuoE [Candidatus Kuenenia stuttgartiensis]MCZ7621940.1 NADH-quinone oxidoreductase subunit NuoE [Candidatus Kuenenia sp